MFYENNFTEENYTLQVNEKSQEIYMISFWLNDRPCFRVFTNDEQENLFTLDDQTGKLMQMDGQGAIDKDFHAALSKRIEENVVLPPVQN